MSIDSDIIVVGAGIGGLTWAAAAAKKGYKVLVFEAGPRIGGYSQSFHRKGFRFNTSIHKIGGQMAKQGMDAFMQVLGEDPLEWYSFEEYLKIGSFQIKATAENLKDLLKERFPHESDNIASFFYLLDKAAEELVYVHDMKGDTNRINFLKIQNLMRMNRITSEQMLNDFFTDEELKGTLYALGDSPTGWAAVTLGVWLRLCEGVSWLPVGGMESILQRLVRIVEANNGAIRRHAPVDRILVQDGKVIGVAASGKQYRSRYVVTNIDIRNVYQDLIEPEHVPTTIAKKLAKTWQSTSSCYTVWMGMDCPIEDLGWSGQNIAYYRSPEQLIQMKRELALGGFSGPYSYCRVGTSGSLDPTGVPPGCSQVSLGFPAGYNLENTWGVGSNGIRGKSYYETKQRVAEHLINVAEDIMPDLRKHLKVMEIGTPLTYERYSRNRQGAYLGFNLSPQFTMDQSRLGLKGELPGLFHCGGWVTNGGGSYKIIIDSLEGVDQLLALEGRDDFFAFEETYINPNWRSVLGKPQGVK